MYICRFVRANGIAWFSIVVLSFHHREMKENNGLLKEEVEGLQRKLERYEKVQAQLVTVELENEVRS